MNANRVPGLFSAAATRLLQFLLRLVGWIGNRRYVVHFRYRGAVYLTSSGFVQHVEVLHDTRLDARVRENERRLLTE